MAVLVKYREIGSKNQGLHWWEKNLYLKREN
jgi:hypothetical protein